MKRKKLLERLKRKSERLVLSEKRRSARRKRLSLSSNDCLRKRSRKRRHKRLLRPAKLLVLRKRNKSSARENLRSKKSSSESLRSNRRRCLPSNLPEKKQRPKQLLKRSSS